MLSYHDRYHGLFVIGESGVGKSNFLASLALHDSAQRFSLVVIEPHGQLVTAILERLPEDRLPDVILLDLTETEFVPGLNLVERPHPPSVENMAASATLAYHVFTKLFSIDQASAPRLMQTLRALIYILMENDATLAESVLVLSSETVRERMVANLTNFPEIMAFWQDYASRPAREQREQTDSTRNKLSAFLALPMVRNMVGQVESLNLGEIMDSGKILLVNLSPRFEEASALIAEIILTKLLLAGFARSDVPEASRRPCMLILDEYQRYATATAAVFLREARKFRIATTLATQTLAGLSEENRAAALACGNLMVFRVSGSLDAPVLAKSFDATPVPQNIEVQLEPVHVPVADCTAHLVRYGHSDPRVARFGQGALRNFEHFMREPEPFAYYRLNMGGTIAIHSATMRAGRQLLNDTFSRCMREHTAQVSIPPLALYLLAAGQKDGCEMCLEQVVKSKGLFPPCSFEGFYLGAGKFEAFAFVHLQALRKRVRWYRPLTQELSYAQALVSLITELRYCMTALGNAPILTPTGEMRRKIQPRMYADMTNQLANELTMLPNYTARVRFLSSGEHVLKTRPLPTPLSGEALAGRIQRIKWAMWEQGLTRYYKGVEKEIREREARWRGETPRETEGRGAKAPPTSY